MSDPIPLEYVGQLIVGSGGGGGGGDVTGPAGGVTNGELAAYNGTSGKLLKSSGVTPDQLRDRSTHTGTQDISTVTGLQAALDGKQPTTAFKTINGETITGAGNIVITGGGGGVAGVASFNGRAGTVTPQAGDYTPAMVGLGSVDDTADADKPISTATAAALGGKVDKVAGKGLSTEDYTSADKSKLAGITAGATANSSDATLLARANHTGTQAISTVTGLQSALDGKQPTTTFKTINGEAITGTGNIVISGGSGGGGAVDSVNGKTGNVTLNKSDIGLSSVDNTADAVKAVASAAKLTTARTIAGVSFDGTANIAIPYSGLTGLPTLGTAAAKDVAAAGDAAAGQVVQGSDTRLTNARTPTAHGHAVADVTGLQAAIDAKVTAVAGKGLSTEDYTTAEKSKLAGVAANANAYTHPASHPPSIITQDASNRFVTDAEKSTWNAKEPAIAAGTAGQYWRGDKTWQDMPAAPVASVAGKTGAVTLAKADVGLGSVDNTSDANKPVSTAQAAAISAKQDTLVSGTSIKTINGASILGAGNLTISGGGGTQRGAAWFTGTGAPGTVPDSQPGDYYHDKASGAVYQLT